MKKKINIYLIYELILIIGVVFSLKLLRKLVAQDESMVYYLSWINNIVFCLQVFILKKRVKNYFNPLVFYSIILFLFSSGQLVLYSLGISIGNFNVLERVEQKNLINIIEYIILCYSLFQLGLIITIKNDNIFVLENENENSKENTKIFIVGMFFFAISIVPYLTSNLYAFIIILTKGYKAYYKEVTRLDSMFLGIGYFIFPGIVLLILGSYKNIKKKYLYLLIFMALLNIFSGDRGGGITIILLVILINIYLIEYKYPKLKKFLIITLFCTSLVPVIGLLRHTNEMGFSDKVIYSINILKENNPLVATLENLGGTLYPLNLVMNIFPEKENFTFGKTYLAAFIRLIPNSIRNMFFKNINNNLLLMSPGAWLQDYLDLSYGQGFTPFAEAYLNFGKYGIFWMFFFGIFIGESLTLNIIKTKNKKLKRGVSLIIFSLILMGTRGSFNSTVSFIFRYAFIPIILIRLLNCRKSNNKI